MRNSGKKKERLQERASTGSVTHFTDYHGPKVCRAAPSVTNHNFGFPNRKFPKIEVFSLKPRLPSGPLWPYLSQCPSNIFWCFPMFSLLLFVPDTFPTYSDVFAASDAPMMYLQHTLMIFTLCSFQHIWYFLSLHFSDVFTLLTFHLSNIFTLPTFSTIPTFSTLM